MKMKLIEVIRLIEAKTGKKVLLKEAEKTFKAKEDFIMDDENIFEIKEFIRNAVLVKKGDKIDLEIDEDGEKFYVHAESGFAFSGDNKEIKKFIS